MKIYKVEEVDSGICTCTLTASAVEKRINLMAKKGWAFEQAEPIVGRFCLIFQRYKMLIVFSKEDDGSVSSENYEIENNNTDQEDLYGSNDDVKNEDKNFIKYNKIPSDVFDKIIDYCPDRGTILKLKNNYRKEDDVYIINNEIDEQNLIFIKNYMTKDLESFNSKK